MCDDCGYADLLELIEEGLITAKRVPLAGAQFADSVCDKLRGIRQTVTNNQCSTPKQWSAVENMIRGLEKWAGPEGS